MPSLKRGQKTSEGGDRLIRKLLTIPFLDGVERSFSITSGGVKSIAHGLGRVPRGFIVIDAQNTFSNIYMSDKNHDTAEFSNSGSGVGELKVWIY